MNATSASVSFREPAVEVLSRSARGDSPGACAVLCSFNGVQHRAVIDVSEIGAARPGDVAAMLEALAREIRR